MIFELFIKQLSLGHRQNADALFSPLDRLPINLLKIQKQY